MGVYGARKMWKVINRTHPGDPVARCTVERRMRALGLSRGCRMPAQLARHVPHRLAATNHARSSPEYS